MIDIGANLTDKSFTDDLPEVLQRANQSGIEKIIVTGVSLALSRRGIELTRRHPDTLAATAGVHPHHADDVSKGWIEELEQLIQHDVVAVGETGLDYFRNFSSRSAQRAVFAIQLELAADANLPVFVHDRDSDGEVLELLQKFAGTPVVVHCFTGDEKTLRAYIDLDCYIGFTGWICDERRGQEVARLTALVPDERILIETDSPYLLPRSIKPRPKSRRNEPSNLVYVLEKLAEERQQSFDELNYLTSANARRLFQFDP